MNHNQVENIFSANTFKLETYNNDYALKLFFRHNYNHKTQIVLGNR